MPQPLRRPHGPQPDVGLATAAGSETIEVAGVMITKFQAAGMLGRPAACGTEGGTL